MSGGAIYVIACVVVGLVAGVWTACDGADAPETGGAVLFAAMLAPIIVGCCALYCTFYALGWLLKSLVRLPGVL